jgi:hypothetical protein
VFGWDGFNPNFRITSLGITTTGKPMRPPALITTPTQTVKPSSIVVTKPPFTFWEIVYEIIMSYCAFLSSATLHEGMTKENPHNIWMIPALVIISMYASWKERVFRVMFTTNLMGIFILWALGIPVVTQEGNAAGIALLIATAIGILYLRR